MTDLIPSDERPPELRLNEKTAFDKELLPERSPVDTSHRQRIRGPSWLAWLIVIALAGFMMFSSIAAQWQMRQDTELARGELIQAVLMGKLAVGTRELGEDMDAPTLVNQSSDFIEVVDQGPIEQRLCHAVLINEFYGARDALEALTQLRQDVRQSDEVQFNENQERIESILVSIFESTAAGNPPQVPEDDAGFLVDEIPWYGKLALNPPIAETPNRRQLLDQAKFAFIFMILAVLTVVVMLALGIVLFFVFVAQMLRGALKHRLADDSRYGPVYIETFAIWFILFVGVSMVAGAIGIDRLTMSVAALTMGLPLMALIWPIVRGIPWSDLREDLGLQLKNPFVEVAAGLVAYVAMLPLLLGSLIVSFILVTIVSLLQSGSAESNEYAPSGVPHPIANELFGSDPWMAYLTILFVAAVLAPVTEEIIFRGVLYRNMRDGSRQMARWMSIGFAALFSSLIFAAIHPQGLIGIPVLTTLAFGFCLVRQWRGSLVAPITMHAVHNAAATSMMIPLIF